MQLFINRIAFVISLLAGLMLPFYGNAQLTTYPLPTSPQVKTGTAQNQNARAKANTLTLPFWDDFTISQDANPDTSKWMNSASVWVNNTVAINQPTLNVATFDGLNAAGLVYSIEDLNVGYTDTLMSKPIDLSSADPQTTFLSFFFQWQGAGEAPDNADFLELSFKDNGGTWRQVMSIFTRNTFERRIFYDTIIQIDSVIFFHDNFQFRFRSYGRESGPFDTWNVDYVYLNDGRSADDLSFPDRAAASIPGPLFGSYTAIPYAHFLAAPLNPVDTVLLDVQNLKSQSEQSVDITVYGDFTNYFAGGGEQTFRTMLMDTTGVKRNPDGTRTGIMTAFERVQTAFDTGLPDRSNQDLFDPNAVAVDVNLDFIFISGDNRDDDRFPYAPIDFTINDTVSRTYYLDDFYAYDDGVAEYAAGLITSGTYMAYQFEKLKPEPDTLIGFDIYFPAFGITSNQTVNFYVFPDDNGQPGEHILNVLKGIERKGPNEFQQVRFSPAALITQQRFYIGWQQPLAGKAIVGLDADNDTGDRIFFSNDRTSWEVNQNVKGSLMIRPVFGSGEVNPVIPAVEDAIGASIYPNPSNGIFKIEGRFEQLAVFDVLGSIVYRDKGSRDLETNVSLKIAPGIYYVRLSRGHVMETHKILIR